ncbi:hypothetical protein VNO78_32902 [Psophocarpus tetragonolobus]|uniref:Leucine-rich repeat-containing N-terminal plant-type domain-containing protein n=1 Tax=Psophocarpus tetragonolobus TaxID=3891 RepID=A0AAN9P059_PSOTE
MVCMMVLQVVYAQHEIRCIKREREALFEFKAALVDHHGMLSSWSTVDCCQWKRIRCSNLTGHIVMLDLRGNGERYISGEIHISLMELPQLKYLTLSFNDFGGNHIPKFLGSLSNLRYLDLSYSDFGGNIPSQLGNLSNLLYLDLSHNPFEGIIPSHLGNLSHLQKLHLSYLEIDDGKNVRD